MSAVPYRATFVRLLGFLRPYRIGLAVSPFRPRDPWAASNSRLRDELVAALATAVVAVHVRAGGVMEGALLI